LTRIRRRSAADAFIHAGSGSSFQEARDFEFRKHNGRSLIGLVNARPGTGALPQFAPAFTDSPRLGCSMVAASRHTGGMPMILPGVIDLRTRKRILLSQMMLFKTSEILASQLQNVVDFRPAVRFSYPKALGPMK